jgi:tetratricopeptide (TPR) repeat protein
VLGVVEVVYVVKSSLIKDKCFKLVRLRNSDSVLDIVKPTSNNNDDSLVEVYVPKKPSFYTNLLLMIQVLQQTLLSFPNFLRVCCLLFCVLYFFHFRLSLHGETTIYKWTIMENHIDGIPSFVVRTLSYGQTHFWYLFKLFYPKHLCFDYGYQCLPVIFDVLDFRNLFPLMTYLTGLSFLYYCVTYMRLSLFLGIALFLIPLLPALNIFIPVGTLLAERLLFVPSIGFCLIVGELLTYECSWIWNTLDSIMSSALFSLEETTHRSVDSIVHSLSSLKQQSVPEKRIDQVVNKKETAESSSSDGANSPKKAVRFALSNKKKSPSSQNISGMDKENNDTNDKKCGIPKVEVKGIESSSSANHKLKRVPPFTSLLFFIFPLLFFGAHRVFIRNTDWKSEYNIYSSALKVCPNSVKALSNYAMLVSAKQSDFQTSLSSALRALSNFPHTSPAMVNAGVAYQKLEAFLPSVEIFELASQYSGALKAFGYIGSTMFQWILRISDPQKKAFLREICLKWIDQSLFHGFGPPSILHLGGSVAFDLQQYSLAIDYYSTALKFAIQNAELRKGSSDVPIEDDVNIAWTINQIGNCYYHLGNFTSALEYFEKGLALDPSNLPLLVNSALLYRQLQKYDKARDLLSKGMALSPDNPSAALFNNLGSLEMELGNDEKALLLFDRALSIVQKHKVGNLYKTQEQGVELRYDTDNGIDVEGLVLRNIEEAKEKLSKRN